VRQIYSGLNYEPSIVLYEAKIFTEELWKP